MAPLIVMLVAWLVARLLGRQVCGSRLIRGLARSALPWSAIVRVHGRLAFPSPHAARPDPDGAREPARAGAAGVGNRCARAARSHRSHGAASAARGRLRPDGATCGNVPCERPRRTGGTEDRLTNQPCSVQSTRTSVRSSPGGRPDHRSTVVRILSATPSERYSVAAMSDALSRSSPKQIVVGIARLDQAVGVQEKLFVRAQGLFQFRVALILDNAKNQPVLVHSVFTSPLLRALSAASGGAQRRYTLNHSRFNVDEEIGCRDGRAVKASAQRLVHPRQHRGRTVGVISLRSECDFDH